MPEWHLFLLILIVFFEKNRFFVLLFMKISLYLYQEYLFLFYDFFNY